MKLKLKMIAVAAAMASMAGAAHADLVDGLNNNPSLALVAFNTVTRDYYIRDTSFLMNGFLPSSVTTLAGDGGVTGDKTPAAGLLLDKTNTANFSDASFSSWLTGQTATDIRWFVSGADSAGFTSATSTNRKRLITSSANAGQTASNGQVDGYVASGNMGGIAGFAGAFGLSTTGTGAPDPWDLNAGLGASSLATLGQSVGLFYFARVTGLTAESSAATQYGNAAGFATVTLASNGDFSYNLAAEAPAAVPVPAAAWLLGSGLVGMGGFMRRRKAAAAAQA